jgi:ferric-dicitrate binding protein FerR (iron transport regulator)
MNALDRLLEEARHAVPDELDDEATDALVRAARLAAEAKTTDAGSKLDALLDAAREAVPVALDERDVRRVAERAAMTGGARHRSWARRRVMLTAGIAGAVAAAAVTLALLPHEPAAPVSALRSRAPAPIEERGATRHGEPTDLELATGDHLVAAPGTRYHVELPGADERAVRLDRGTMLFDVRPTPGGQFSVSTPEAEVVVLGTVFTVNAGARGTTVRVYEGRVEVRADDRVRIVEAGGLAHFGEGSAAADSLRDRGEEAARARLAQALAEPAPAFEAEPDPVANPSERSSTPAPLVMTGGTGPRTAEPRLSFDEARALIATEPARALAEARRATQSGDVDPWRMLEGDALRALGRIGEAADVYGQAARELAPPRRAQAGFLEARLRATDLADAEGALSALRGAGVTAPGSPLRERGLALEADLLARLGRSAELANVATQYLRDYPEGPRADAMRAHAIVD